MRTACCPDILPRTGKFLCGLHSSVWFARLVILLFLVKMHWGMWETWEWTMGDEAVHYTRGSAIHSEWWNWTMSWSPLYRAYYGAVSAIISDPFTATLVHRVIVIFTAVFLLFEVVRRLIPVPFALFVTLWWASIQGNINPLYTVHLFAHVANLVPILLFAASRTSRGRGWALALLAGSALFVRNETVACVLFVICFLNLYEWLLRRKGIGISWKEYLLSYGVPLVTIMAVWLGSCGISENGIKGTVRDIQEKAAFNFSQNYAFTYFLRHPNTEGNVWYKYKEICEEDFGEGEVSVGKAVLSNPKAFGEHMSMNLSNLPASLQLTLFNVRGSARNPDVIPTTHNPKRALFLTCAWGVLIIIGGWLIIADRKWFYEQTFRPHFAAWICFLGFLLQTIPVAILILSRQSFLITGASFLFLFTGLCSWAVWRKLPRPFHHPSLFPVASILALILVPSIWANRPPPYDAPRALLRALGDRREIMAVDGTHILGSIYQAEATGKFLDPAGKISVDGLDVLLPILNANAPLGDQLNKRRIKLFFACGEETESNPSYQKFAADPGEFDWKATGIWNTGPVYWKLFEPVAPYPEDLEILKNRQDLKR